MSFGCEVENRTRNKGSMQRNLFQQAGKRNCFISIRAYPVITVYILSKQVLLPGNPHQTTGDIRLQLNAHPGFVHGPW